MRLKGLPAGEAAARYKRVAQTIHRNAHLILINFSKLLSDRYFRLSFSEFI